MCQSENITHKVLIVLSSKLGPHKIVCTMFLTLQGHQRGYIASSKKV